MALLDRTFALLLGTHVCDHCLLPPLFFSPYFSYRTSRTVHGSLSSVVHPDKEDLFGGPHTIVDITGILTPIKIRTLPTTKTSFGVIPFGL